MEELSFMTLKSDAKFEKKIDLQFGKWHDELGKFSKRTWKSQNLDFNGIILSKVEHVWA